VGIEPTVDRKTFRIRWKDGAGHRHHIDPPLTPNERAALQKNADQFQRVTRDPYKHIPGQPPGNVAIRPNVQSQLDDHAAQIRRLGKRVVEDVVEIGRRLVKAKELTKELEGPGHWLSWLEREFEWTDRQALNYTRVYEMASRSEKFSEVSIPVSGLYLLAAPSTPESARQEVIDRAANGESPSVAEVKEIIQEHKSASIAEEGEIPGATEADDVCGDRDHHADDQDDDSYDHGDAPDDGDYRDEGDDHDHGEEEQDEDDHPTPNVTGIPVVDNAHEVAPAGIEVASAPVNFAGRPAIAEVAAQDQQIGIPYPGPIAHEAQGGVEPPAPATATRKSTKRSILNTWDESPPDERELIADLVLEQYFELASGTDIFAHIPVARRTEVMRDLLDRLTVDGMCQVISPEFRKQLQASVQTGKPQDARCNEHLGSHH
jgi:hypothetical protein